MRFFATATAAAVAATLLCSAPASAAPRTVTTPDFTGFEALDASADGRAWARGRGHSFVLGPADAVRRLDDDATPPPWESTPPSRAGRLVLGEDGTLELDGKPAPLPDALLRGLGLRSDRRALAYDAGRDRYLLVRSRRPLLSGGYENVWSVVWFTPARIVEESSVPEEISLVGKPLVAAGNAVAWIGEPAGLLRWADGAWTEFGDEDLVRRRRAAKESERKDFVTTVAVFGLGNALSSSLFSLPVSLAGKQRYLPTAATSYVGSFPAIVTAGAFAFGANGFDGDLGRAISVVAYGVGIATLPVVALATYGTGELAFHGTNDSAYLGALGGAAAGALVWTLTSIVLPEGSLRDQWWWVFPMASGFISSSSTAGYLWAGHGFSHY